MFPFIFVLFVVMPVIEIAILIKVGGILGVWTTIIIVIFTAVLGTVMLRAQSLSTIQSVQSRMNAGQLPAMQMMEGVVLLIGGVLLLTPGFITDGLGFFCLIPQTRRWLLKKAIARAKVSVFSGHPSSDTNTADKRKDKADPGVIEGKFRRED